MLLPGVLSSKELNLVSQEYKFSLLKEKKIEKKGCRFFDNVRILKLDAIRKVISLHVRIIKAL